MGVARLGVVGAGAAEVLHRDVLAGDGLDDVGAGDEHVGGAVDHDREVGDRGGVDVAARAGAHDQADLRDHAAGVHVALEDLAVEAERDHALLDAGAGALVDADDRAAGLDGEVHHLGDLLAVHLAERAAEDGEVLGEHADLAAVDGAEAGDHAVAVGAVLLQPEGGRAVPGELVELDEGALVEELLDALAGGPLPLACCFSTALAEPACTASSMRRSRSASLPAVVWMSMSSGTSVPPVCAHGPGCAVTGARQSRRFLRDGQWPIDRTDERWRVEAVAETDSTNADVAERFRGRRAGGPGARRRAPDRGARAGWAGSG